MTTVKSHQDIIKLKKSFWRSTILLSVFLLLIISGATAFITNSVRIMIFKNESVRIIQKNLENNLQFDLDELMDTDGKHKNVLDLISYMSAAFDLSELKIWSDDMRNVYSFADKSMVGKYNKDDSDLKKSIMSDIPVLTYNDGDDFMDKSLDKGRKALLEMYVPVHMGGKVHGVIEVYRLAPGFNLLGKVNIYAGLLVILIGILYYTMICSKFRTALNSIMNYQNYLHSANLHIVETYLDSVVSLAKALELRDKETEGHCERVVNMSMYIGNRMGLDSISMGKLAIGAYLHDVGKIGIPDSILLKPGRLTPDERKIIETHVIKGDDIIKNVPFLKYAEYVVKYHHEKYDGTGYPYGLKGDQIPMVARIFALTDVFDALISRRPYKDPMPLDKILEIIKQERGKHFCPEVCDILLSMSKEEIMTINKNVVNEGIADVVQTAVTELMAEETKDSPSPTLAQS